MITARLMLFSTEINTECAQPGPVGEQPDSAIEFVPESLMVHEIEQVKVKTKDTRVIKGQLESDIDDYYERGYWD